MFAFEVSSLLDWVLFRPRRGGPGRARPRAQGTQGGMRPRITPARTDEYISRSIWKANAHCVPNLRLLASPCPGDYWASRKGATKKWRAVRDAENVPLVPTRGAGEGPEGGLWGPES
eukprot:9234292-Pyramimonas_sp.AAC.1